MPSCTRIVLAASLTVATAGLAGAGGSPAAPSRATTTPRTCSTSFVASVRRGPRAGTDYAGVLTLRLDARGRLRGGSFAALRGGRVAVTTHRHGHAVSLGLVTRDGTLRGMGTVDGSLRRCVGRMRGQLKGPGRADRGTWLATTGQTLQLPGGVQLLTSAESANHPNPQVVYRIQGLNAATVFVGALNTPGAVDGQRLAARMNRPSGLGYDAAKSLVYVADVANAGIRRLDLTTNAVTTTLRASDFVAAAHAAGFPGVTGWEPQGVAVASGGGGALLIADVRNYVIWRYNPATLALKLYAGMPGVSGNADGSDTAVRFSAPQQIVASSDGLVAVAEPTTQRVRLREPSSGHWSTVGVCC